MKQSIDVRALTDIPILGTFIPKMGTKTGSWTLSSALFSRVQCRVLGILFGHPDTAFQLTDIIAKAGSGRGAVQRELEKLTHVGIVDIITLGNRKLYRTNRQSPIFAELQQLVLKTVGIIDPLKEALETYRDSIAVAFVYGSLAKGSDTAKSDIDVMIIADQLSYSDVYSSLQKAERILARPVSPNVIAPGDWGKKIKAKSSFILKILNQPKLFVFGTEDELRAIR